MTEEGLDFNYQVLKSPLCGFCLSPQFSIRPPQTSASRRLSVRSWRRGGSSLPSVPPRFKPFNRRSSNFLPKYLTEFLITGKSRKTLTLQEVLDEIQKVWTPTRKYKPPELSSLKMDERFRKSSSVSNNEISPVLLRRRLSAPETIMRKHMLAQQRSGSQDSEITQSSEAKSCQWRGEMDAGSDSNLNRKRDPDLMRKSTLLRRLWSHTKPASNTRFTGTFYEWQHSYGKLSSGKSTHSLTSIHSSPEHLVRSQSKRSLNGEFRTSPQHKQTLNSTRKMSPKHQLYDTTKQNSTQRKISVYSNGNFDSYSSSFTDITRSTTTTATTPKTITETESSAIYTTFSENSDSAYTNSASNFSEISNNNNNSSTTPSEIYKSVIEETDVSNKDAAQHKVTETSVQTTETTNVNVISNVELSQSTLDLIFNHVMQDVRKTLKSGDETLKVQAIPSFYLNKKHTEDNTADRNSRIVKYMISNVGTGSPYSKPAEVPQVVVPRFSALPRTSSMEVNISSGDSTDKESDCVSLVDSLEDASIELRRKSDLSLPLPDNSDKKKIVSRPTAFYIPIEIDNESGFKPVSDHLPEKVRNKLAKRQQKREEKIHQSKSKNSSSRSDSNYISASDNGNQFSFAFENGSDVNLNSAPLPHVNYNNRQKKRNKPLLPSIESFRKTKPIDANKREQKPVKRKEKSADTSKVKHHWAPREIGKNKTPTYSSRNEYVYDYGPGKIYHKTEFNNSNKRIEILQIMECVEASGKISQQLSRRSRSKIPILVHHQRLPKINQHHQQSSSFDAREDKPTFLDLDGVQITDPKLDQLIANILIETLNSPELQNFSQEASSSCEKKAKSPVKSARFQKFEAIPEEMSLQSSTDDKSNNNSESRIANNNNNESNSYQGKAAVAVIRDENFSSIPKGWITFYMLHKNRGSPDSTSDEGKKFSSDNKTSKSKIVKTNSVFDVIRKETNYSSSSENQIRSNKSKKMNNQNARKRYKSTDEKFIRQLGKGEWSVTVSGTNSYGQQAPNLEMCLRFPDNNNKKESSDCGADDVGVGPLSRLSNSINNNEKNEAESEDSWRTRLPDIPKNKLGKKDKKSASSLVRSLPNPVSSRIIEPRQTRTSTRRYNLTRPKVDYAMDTRSTLQFFDDRRYAEILRRFPEILSITGSAVSQDKK